MTNNNSAQLLITTEGGMQTVGEAAAQFNDINLGFTHYLEGLALPHNKFSLFIEEVTEKYSIHEYDFSTPSGKSCIYLSDSVKIYSNVMSKNTIFDVLCKSLEDLNHIFKLYSKKLEVNTDVRVHFHDYFYANGKLDHKVKFIEPSDYTSNTDLYYPYIDTTEMYKQFLGNQENILVLLGKPGVGKSKMANSIIKHMLQNPDDIPYQKGEIYENSEEEFISVAYVKNEDILSDDMFWRQLETGIFDIVILDDLDYFLAPRDNTVQSQSDVNKNKFISQLLSYTDGVSKNNTKFIITSNRSAADTDPAVLRKGRLFDILELQDLSTEEALLVWKHYELPEAEFEKLYSESLNILPADLGSEIARRTNKKKISTKAYLKRDGISLVKKSKKVRKVGF